MRSIEIPKHGGPDVFKIVEKADPVISKPNEIAIDVKAFGLNFADIMMREGLYPEAPPPPFVPGYEVSGIVSAVGSAVSDVRVGDRVCAGTKFGGYTTKVVVEEPQILKLPESLSFVEGAAIPVNFLTAWCALVDMARVRAGDCVYIPNAAGGVGLAAVQLCKLNGATVFGSCSSEAKFATLKEFGVDVPFLYDDELKIFAENKFDIILDAGGGSHSKVLFDHLKAGGRIIHFGNSSMIPGARKNIFKTLSSLVGLPLYHPVKLMMNNKGVFGLNMLKLFEHDPSGMVVKAGIEMMKLFEARKLKVRCEPAFQFDQVGAAHTKLKSRTAIGKVVVVTE